MANPNQIDPKSSTKPSEVPISDIKQTHIDTKPIGQTVSEATGERLLSTHEAPSNMPIKRKRGQPTKYKSIYCQQIIAFFDRDHTYEGETTHTNKKGETWTAYSTKANPVPLMCSFARYLGVDITTLNEWCKVHSDYSKASTHAQELQLEHLNTVSGMGLYNSNWAVFMAKNISSWRDKKDIEHSGTIDSTLFVEAMIDKSDEAEANERNVLGRLN